MNDTFAQYFKILFKFTLTDSHKGYIPFLHILSMACISLLCVRHIMPEITIKLYDKIKRRNVCIHSELSYAVLLDILKSHDFKKLIANYLQRSWGRSLLSTFPTAILCTMKLSRCFDAMFLSTISTNDSDTNAGAVFSYAGRRTEVAEIIRQTRLNFVNILTTVKALNNFPVFSWLTSLLRRMQSRASGRTEVTLALSEQEGLLIYLFTAMIALNKYASKVRVIDTAMSSIMTWFTTKLTGCHMGIVVSLKGFSAVLTGECLLFLRSISTGYLIACPTAILSSLLVRLKGFPALRADVFTHELIIPYEVAF